MGLDVRADNGLAALLLVEPAAPGQVQGLAGNVRALAVDLFVVSGEHLEPLVELLLGRNDGELRLV